MFGWLLDTTLRWCILCKLKGVLFNSFLSFWSSFFPLPIKNFFPTIYRMYLEPSQTSEKEKPPSWMFDQVFNTPLCWCVLWNFGRVPISVFNFVTFFCFILLIGNFLRLFYIILIFRLNLLFVPLFFLINLAVYSFYIFNSIVSPQKICKNRIITICIQLYFYITI